MIFGYFILFVALLISTVAEYYSIAGLVAIFSAAPIPVIVMGAVLAIGKIVATVWLKINWHRASWQYKVYLVPAIIFLMLLTSMGIFGFLSQAHSDQNLISGDSQAKVAIYDEKIKTSRDNIEANRRALKQLDEAVDQVMGRSTDEKGADKAVAVRRAQTRERTRLLAEIAAEQKVIAKLSEERAPLAAEVRKVEAEVGPLKYIAALVYGDNPDQNILEKAVRLVIILIVLVFDPLALVLILAGNKQLEWARGERNNKLLIDNPGPEVGAEAKPKVVEPGSSEVDHYDDPGKQPSPPTSVVDQFAYLKKPFVHFKDLEPKVAPAPLRDRTPDMDKITQSIAKDPKFDLPNVAATINEAVNSAQPVPVSKIIEYHSDSNVPVRQVVEDYVIPAMPDGDPVNAGFGTAFQSNPKKGDLFLRVDYLPNKLFRYNGAKWIEIDKNLTDSYAFNEEYIRFLIDKINNGEYNVEDLSDTEQEQIREYLKQ